jgi:CDP-glucose 4,6-dehydratase
MTEGFWRGRPVFLTGHTGFKGSWLSLWLHDLGAVVSGYALAPPSTPSLYELARVGEIVHGAHADVRDLPGLRQAMADARPEVVVHMAAQSLVRPSYEQPVATFATNVMGTVHVLEAARATPAVHAVVVVTSDKCYEDRAGSHAYREGDSLGGHDPYAASKACAELVTRSYRLAFGGAGPRIASVRAGNTLGGGDWARDRLVPDLVRALGGGRTAVVRNPDAVRPWQHVLEPLAGYLEVAERLHAGASGADDAWNFGPGAGSERSVSELATEVCVLWGTGAAWRHEPAGESASHETRVLTLDAARARARLGWAPRLDYHSTVRWTVDWYRAVAAGADARATTLDQIRRYRGLPR